VALSFEMKAWGLLARVAPGAQRRAAEEAVKRLLSMDCLGVPDGRFVLEERRASCDPALNLPVRGLKP
jgi:hypothetical protein